MKVLSELYNIREYDDIIKNLPETYYILNYYFKFK